MGFATGQAAHIIAPLAGAWCNKWPIFCKQVVQWEWEGNSRQEQQQISRAVRENGQQLELELHCPSMLPTQGQAPVIY